jgi:glycosyltransferase involved in cell wall biosynthesis
MRIGHYMRKMFEPGGIASYLRRVSGGLRGRGCELVYFDLASERMATPEAIEYVANENELGRRAREMGIDVLHLHCAVHEVPSGTPVVRTVHTHSPYCPSQGRFLKRSGSPCDRNYSLLGCLWGHAVDRCGSLRPAALGRNFATARAERRTLATIPTIVVSQFLKRQMVRAGYAADGIEVIPLPAPEARAYAEPPREGPPRFVFLGRMIPHKGVDWLLRATTRVRHDVRIELAGTGNQETEYRALAKRLGLDGRVRFHGWLEGGAVEELLRGARGLVFPSIWHEPAGLVAFEAITHGRAVIGSRVGGMAEMIDEGVNGLLVAPGNVTALAAAIDRLAGDRELARRMGEAGRRIAADRFTTDAHLDRLMSVYDRLVRADKSGGEAAAAQVR